MTPAELDALIARGERFVLKDGSETGHCCFQFSIIDVTKPNLPVCECFNREDADAILSALRQGRQDAARLRGVVDALEPFRKSLALIDEATSCDIELMARRRAECDAYYSAQSALAAIAAEKNDSGQGEQT